MSTLKTSGLEADLGKARSDIVGVLPRDSDLHEAPLDITVFDEITASTNTAFERIKRTRLASLYYSYLRDKPAIRYVVVKSWRYLFPIGARIWLYLRPKESSYRFLSLSDYSNEKNIFQKAIYSSVQVLTPKPHVEPSEDAELLISPHESYEFPQVYVVVLDRGYVIGGSNFIRMDDCVIHHDLFSPEMDYTSEELHGRVVIDPAKKSIGLLSVDETPVEVPVAATFVDAWAPNYAHWMTEVLPRIAAFCSIPEHDQIPIIINHGLHPNILDSLKTIAGSARKYIALSSGRGLKVNKLYCTSVAGYVPFERRPGAAGEHSHGKFSPLAFKGIEREVRRKLYSADLDTHEKILLKRPAGIRAVSNFSSIEKILEANGFKVVEPQLLSFAEQVRIFRSAKFIVGSSGAALANLIFMRPDAQVFILIGRFSETSYWYWQNIACASGGKIRYVLGTPDPSGPISIHSDFVIPDNLLIKDVADAGGIEGGIILNGMNSVTENGLEGADKVTSRIEICQIIDLPKINDPRGNLTFVEAHRHFPFSINRVYYLYDVPGGAERGGHAHKELHQLIIAMSGSFDIHLDDGNEKKTIHLNRSYNGLYVCPMIWREIDNFSSGAVCMVLASDYYSEADYYRNYSEFTADVKAGK